MNSPPSRTQKYPLRPRGLLLVALLSTGPAWTLEAGVTLPLGGRPQHPAPAIRALFAPLARPLTTLVSLPVLLDAPPAFSAFWQHLGKQRDQLAHLNQYQYHLRAHARHGFNAIAMNEEFGSGRIASVICGNDNSLIGTLGGLRGKVLLPGGGRDATTASIVPRYIMAQAGLPWTVIRSNAPTDASAIADALLQMNNSAAGKAALKSADLTGLRRASDADYAPHRKIIRQVLRADYR